ncbi:diphosphomevalonate decarboxylase [Pokkaliibacter sp. CJK22405]|uniref:diphosphomevalonate decarboxylase n=1 Tax=Pokkaliibacter sp. CJK22405 TaxID=3384615 RepID=UPI003984FFB4
MSLSPSDAFLSYLPKRTSSLKVSAEAFAPSNIALCKYWGKRDPALNLPVNSSLSISLGSLGTSTRVTVIDSDQDQVVLNGQVQAADSAFVRKCSAFVDHFRQIEPVRVRIETENNIPTAAGLASSASGFAALTLALAKLYGYELVGPALSRIARMGSGSASRSLYQGFAEWEMGAKDNGSDSQAIALSQQWPSLRVGVLEVTRDAKTVDSRSGMNRTTQTSHLYSAWPQQAKENLLTLKAAIAEQDIHQLGATAEQNALSMHATMVSSWPPLLYWQPDSVKLMHQVWQCRESGVPVYFTMDAGPNLKLLFEESAQSDIEAAFTGLEVVNPWAGPCPLND